MEKLPKTAYYVLSKKPLIIVTVWNLWHHYGMEQYFMREIKQNKTNFIFLLWWSCESRFGRREIKRWLHRHRSEFPNQSFTFLCNTQSQYEKFTTAGIPCIFCNQNSLLDEKIFRIMKCKKGYDAVYNAQMSWFKRHWLASGIKNLALITYFDKATGSKVPIYRLLYKLYYELSRRILTKAHWINASPMGSMIGPAEVAKTLNKSKVGLCLSPWEGAMYASAEYLLCGLPVVSTKSVGGRDVFFDERYVKIVPASAKAVKSAVDDFVSSKIDAEFIRDKTLEKMEVHRQRFIDLIQGIYTQEGVRKDFQKEWEKVFINKMWKWQSIGNLGRLD